MYCWSVCLPVCFATKKQCMPDTFLERHLVFALLLIELGKFKRNLFENLHYSISSCQFYFDMQLYSIIVEPFFGIFFWLTNPEYFFKKSVLQKTNLVWPYKRKYFYLDSKKANNSSLWRKRRQQWSVWLKMWNSKIYLWFCSIPYHKWPNSQLKAIRQKLRT